MRPGNCPSRSGLAVAYPSGAVPGGACRVIAATKHSGGVLLEGWSRWRWPTSAWDRLLHRLDDDGRRARLRRHRSRPGHEAHCYPGRCATISRHQLEQLRWRSYGTAAEVELPIRAPGYRTTLIRVRPGRMVPQHTHEGNELTVVLEGAFHDETGHYGRGDLAIADSSVDHRPVADEAEDCLCLAVTEHRCA